MVFKGPVDFFVLKAAFDLGLFEAMASGPLTVTDLAAATETVPHRLERLLIAMEQVGLVRAVEGAWALTPLSEQFYTAPDKHRNATMLPFVEYMVDMFQSYYANLADVARGKSNFTTHVPYPPRTREDSSLYETIHRSNLHFVLKLLREHADLAGVSRLIDVGGGIGDVAATLCERFPELNVTLLNLPSAIELVRENVAARGLSERITPLALDIYKEAYPQGDAVMLCRMLYPMNRNFCALFLQKAAAALAPGGRVLILDMVISDPEKPNYDYLSHYLGGVGMDFSVLDFKDHRIYPGLLEELGFTAVNCAEGYNHVLYQAVKA